MMTSEEHVKAIIRDHITGLDPEDWHSEDRRLFDDVMRCVRAAVEEERETIKRDLRNQRAAYLASDYPLDERAKGIVAGLAEAMSVIEVTT